MNFVQYKNLLPGFLVVAAALASLVYGLFRKKIDPQAKYNHLVRLLQFISFAFLGIAFVPFASKLAVFGLFLWAIVLVFLMFTERKVFHDTFLVLNNEGLFVPGYFSSHRIPWNVISDLVARPDFVTITRTNQHFVQLEVLTTIQSTELEAINAFSCQQILANPQEPATN